MQDARKKIGIALMELIGTAILVFTIQVAIASDTGLAPLAIGAILITIVFAGGPISGAHYNPAVSLAITLRGKLSSHEMIVYWISQVIGGFLGGLIGGGLGNTFSVVSVGPESTITQAFFAEMIFTFILCLVVLGVATNSKADQNHYYGLAIGLVVMSGAIAVGPISGGAFNPAVALGLSISKGFANFGYAFNVVIAELIGGVLAAFCFFLVAPDECEVTKANAGETMPLSA